MSGPRLEDIPERFEYPGYLRLPPLIQTGTQSSTPQTSQMGYLLTEVMIILCRQDGRPWLQVDLSGARTLGHGTTEEIRRELAAKGFFMYRAGSGTAPL